MGFNDFLKSIFGSKSERDLKKLKPYVDKVKAVYPEIEALDNDGLRARSAEIREGIKEAIRPLNEEINAIREEIEKLDYDKREGLWNKIDKLDEEILEIIEEKLTEALPTVFAIVKETARRFAQNETVEVTATDFDRKLAADGHDFLSIEGDKAIYVNHWVAGGNEITWDMVHYDVQLIGGTVLFQGKIAEMATGEGKTLVATLPVFLRALAGRGVHVVTVNDYLAKRDSEWMGPLYMFHGLSVSCIDKTTPNSHERRDAYKCDITFGTNSEFGFDYLRDNMATDPDELVQRPHYFAIVDEVDSVLIDDARTPLIISGPVPKGEDQMFDEFKPNVERVYRAQLSLVNQLVSDARKKFASDNPEDVKEGSFLLFRAFKGMPKYKPLIKLLSQEGVNSKMLDTEKIYMQDNNREMHVVTDPLFFIIDEKNNTVELTDKGIDVLTQGTDDPKFFVLPDITSELSAVSNEKISDEEKLTKKDELLQNYSVKAERVHTVTQLLKAYTLFNRDDEYIVDEEGKVKIVDEQTGRIMEGRRYSDGLHQAIEAKEGVKVEAATQTFATVTLQNYFRMYYKLAGMTGTAMTEAGEFWEIYKLDVVNIPTNKPVIRRDMPDRVYRTEREKFNAVIDEIVKMSEMGRPVLVGTTSVEISERLKRQLKLRHIDCQVLNAKYHQQEAEIVAQAGQQINGKGVVTVATNMAGRGTDIKLAKAVKEMTDDKGNLIGGLAIIGTERHESRRVDNQLRGRAGRQGDPGSSVFFVSFEDKVMRWFATNKRVLAFLDRQMTEGEAIESKMVSRSIENAQKRVEENHFGQRKHTLEYDDVMNVQRKVIYSRRNNALKGERIGTDIIRMLEDVCSSIVDKFGPDEYEDFRMQTLSSLAIEPSFGEDEFRALDSSQVLERLIDDAIQAFNRKTDRLREDAVKIVTRFAAAKGVDPSELGMGRFEITDGRKKYYPLANAGEVVATAGRSFVKEWQKAILLHSYDEVWKRHLLEIDQLRQSVQNASYEQKDPLVIYKIEAYNLFESTLGRINDKAVSVLMRGQIPMHEENEMEQQRDMPKHNMPRTRYNEGRGEDEMQRAARLQRQAAMNASHNGGPVRNTTPVRVGPKVGRNDPCPCGSGKKYKNCHGKIDQQQ
ncbi:MAG: preprotein translocase subunit SecA [Muribaculaceae bacterium]|nr:preprotein translocase subunit SecA [Muribaculaceae bacterium]